jgi:polyisoprenoid-binding protein YceI
MSLRIARLLIALGIAAACSAPQTTIPTPHGTSPSPTTASQTAGGTLPAGVIRFTIVPSRSQATIRVREQVAGIPAPGEAVLTTRAFSGSLVLLADDTFATGSLIAVDLDTLKSDSDLRDEWIKLNTLQTRAYPRAEFVVARVSGVPLPLPAEGEWTVRIEGTMRIHGVERPLTWDLRAMRSSGEIRVRGETAFRFGDYGMAVPANRLILSVVDDVRIEIDLVARDA